MTGEPAGIGSRWTSSNLRRMVIGEGLPRGGNLRITSLAIFPDLANRAGATPSGVAVSNQGRAGRPIGCRLPAATAVRRSRPASPRGPDLAGDRRGPLLIGDRPVGSLRGDPVSLLIRIFRFWRFFVDNAYPPPK